MICNDFAVCEHTRHLFNKAGSRRGYLKRFQLFQFYKSGQTVSNNKGGCKCQARVCTSAEPTQQEINSKFAAAAESDLQHVIGREVIPFL